MSYDIRLEIDTGGNYPAWLTECRSPTYNLEPMFRKALEAGGVVGGMRGTVVSQKPYQRGEDGLDGMLAKDALPKLQIALQHMRENREDYEKLNPPNGWGDYGGAVRTFELLIEDCENHPKATVRV